MTAERTKAQEIENVATELGLSLSSVFVPWSLSRNAGEKSPSLNWKVTLRKVRPEFDVPLNWKVRPEFDVPVAILTTDYGAGCGHCPSYTPQNYATVDGRNKVKRECETGFSETGKPGPILPSTADVISSLVMDSDAIDYSSFEEWASNFGYEEDSRKAEAIYRQCLDIALKLRNAIGEAGLTKLQEACQDY